MHIALSGCNFCRQLLQLMVSAVNLLSGAYGKLKSVQVSVSGYHEDSFPWQSHNVSRMISQIWLKLIIGNKKKLLFAALNNMDGIISFGMAGN